MRIVAGNHKGRPLASPKGRDTRPTSDRTRGAVFNILEHGFNGFTLKQAHVLDVFAGTGALGLKALSRGASSATFIERGREALKCLDENIAALKVAEQTQILKADATRPPIPRQACSLIFLDPPYGKGLVPLSLAALLAKGWIAPASLCVAETGSHENETFPEGFELLDTRVYGAAKITFLKCGVVNEKRRD